MRAPGSGCCDSPDLPAEGTIRCHHLQQVLVPQPPSMVEAHVSDPTALAQPCIPPQLLAKDSQIAPRSRATAWAL